MLEISLIVALASCASPHRLSPSQCAVIGAGLGAVGGSAGATLYAENHSAGGAVGIGTAGVASGAALGWAVCRLLQVESEPVADAKPEIRLEPRSDRVDEAPRAPETPAEAAPEEVPAPEPEFIVPPPEPAIADSCAGTIELPGLHFAVGQAVIRLDSFDTLDVAIERLVLCSDERVRVEGHTDSTGSADLNQLLSEARAQVVRTYLVEAGIDAERAVSAGFGGDRPVAPNDTATGRARNRRVEIRFLDTDESTGAVAPNESFSPR